MTLMIFLTFINCFLTTMKKYTKMRLFGKSSIHESRFYLVFGDRKSLLLFSEWSRLRLLISRRRGSRNSPLHLFILCLLKFIDRCAQCLGIDFADKIMAKTTKKFLTLRVFNYMSSESMSISLLY
ncbi:hypothetical protein HHI36_015389 [Cryptolaemus montrouzieri]|uniref:Uncharacterized protein n=1 Tax=Cryptolaemus montrouzieri TaxID=559131 RepID=A0ABD2N5X1_9CUCU